MQRRTLGAMATHVRRDAQSAEVAHSAWAVQAVTQVRKKVRISA
jgi:hypothetical protein